MADLFEAAGTDCITIDQKMAAVQREIDYRKYVYPRRVNNGKMAYSTAQREILTMEAILEDYKAQASQEQLERLKRKPRARKVTNTRQRSADLETPMAQIQQQVKAHTKCRLCHDTGVDPSSTDPNNLLPCRRCVAANE